MIEPYYEEPNIKIYCGDCLEIMQEMPDKSIDLVLTDFPYANDTNYGIYEDTFDNLLYLIKNAMPQILRTGKIALIACGIGNMFYYPNPDWVLSWHWTHTHSGSSHWGFNNWQPILSYGKDPYLANKMGRRQDSIPDHSIHECKYGHPCQKPLKTWKWFLLRGSINESDIILDPFLGSGTTLVACKELNRKGIGIEISKEYCDIAVQRLKNTTPNLL